MSEATQTNKSVCVSLPKRLIDDIDRRADSLGLTRSMYLTLLAQQDLQILGPLIVRSAEARQPKIVKLTDEAHRFLIAAIPELADYERRVRLKQPQEDETATAPPEEQMAELWEHFLNEREDILKNKWYRSGEAGKDVGIEAAIRDWLEKYATHPQSPPAP